MLGHIHCFRQCEIVGSQILLYGAQPCDAGSSSWSPPVLWRESWQDPLGICVIVHTHNVIGLLQWVWIVLGWSFARLIAPVVATTSIVLSSNKIQNEDILVPANPGPPGKMAIKTERELRVIVAWWPRLKWSKVVCSNPSRCAVECNPGHVVYIHTFLCHQAKQYNLVPANGRWCSAAGEVSTGLTESNGSLAVDLWLWSPAGWLPRTRISARTLCSY